MAISHEEVMAKLSPERRARIETRNKELIEEEMTLRIVGPALTAFSRFERIKNIRIDSGMHLIAIRELRQAAEQFSDVASQIEDWNQVVKGATWQNLEEVRQTYRSAEAVRNFTVFNINYALPTTPELLSQKGFQA